MKSLPTLLLCILISINSLATDYYVNDNSTNFDIYCTTIGNAANSGLTPADPFLTLQDALSAASSGDEIFVDAGNYNDINLSVPAGISNLKITGAGIATTVFDASGTTGTYLFMNVRGHNTEISNMTVQNYESKGAVDILGSSTTDSTTVTFNSCYFNHNGTYTSFDTNPHGGAIYLSGTSGNLPGVLILNECQFADNLSEQSQGGGAIFADDRCRIQAYGSRFVCNNSRAILTTYEGGAILLNGAYGSIDSCYISGSPVFGQQGGGLRAINSGSRLSINIRNTIFTENIARQGAAIYVEDNIDCNIVNCLIFANTVTGGFGNGGSISCDGSVNMSIINSTIADNLSSHASDGGGLAADGSTSYNVLNSIIWNNDVSNVRNSSITATYSDIEPVNTNHSGTTGNITADPLFNLTAGDYTLQGTSPCVNLGNTTGAPTTDLTNLTRTGGVDMGAFEDGAVFPQTSAVCSLFLTCTPPTILPLTALSTSICEGEDGTITIANSEFGIFYQLINDGTNTNVGSPIGGNGGTISLPAGSLTTTTQFSVEAFDPNLPSCTSDLGPITITVNPTPTVTISSTEVCLDGSVTLTPTTGGAWTSNNTSVATVTTSGIITLVSSGNVDFTFTESSANCTATTSNVTVNPLPVVSVSNNTICEDGALTLSPTSGGTWISNNTSVATLTPGGIVTIIADGTVDFTFTESTNSCSATTSSVTINPTPTISISSNEECINGSVTISPTTGGTWTSNNTSVATVSPAGVVTFVSDGTVDFTFTDATTNCTATSTVLTINPLPVVSVSSTEICEDGNLTLSPNTGGTWISNNTSVATVTSGGTVTILSDGLVDFTFTNSTTNCSSTTSTVTVNPLPVVSVSSNTICEEGSLTLSPTTGGTWVSNNPSVATVTTSGTVTIISNGSVDFTFTESVNGCTSTTSSVTINPTPIVTTSSNDICLNENLTLTPITGGTWVSNNTSVATITSGGLITLITDGTVDFTFTESTNNCLATTNLVTVNPLPSISISSSNICEDGTVTLTPTTGGTWISNNTSVATVTPSGTVTIIEDGNVDFTFTESSNGCSATTNTLTVNPLPSLTVSPSDVCLDGSLTLSPTSGGNWVSNNPTIATVTSSTGVVNLIADGTVDFTFTESTNGCSNTTNTVTVNPLPLVTVSSNSVCTDGTLTLSPTTGGTWVSNNSSVASVSSGGSVTILSSGTVDFTFTNTTTNCSNTTSTVTINSLPSATAVNNGPVCVGEALSLTGGASGLTYLWAGPNGFSSTSQSPTVSLSAANLMGGIYTLTVNDGNCSNTITTTATVNDLPIIDITNISTNDPSVCGGNDGSIIGISGSGAPTLSYSWNNNAPQSTPDLTSGTAGSYSIVLTDGNGCITSAGPFVISDPTPPAQPSITLNPSAVCLGGSFTISVNSPDPAATYAWVGPNGYTNSGSSITLTNITNLESGNYTVTPTIAGCTGGTSLPANVIVNNLPIVDILTPIDVDCNNPSITLDGSNSDQGVDITYQWSTADGNITGSSTTDIVNADASGTYTLLVNNVTTGCLNSSDVSVLVDTLTPVANAITSVILPCGGVSVSLDGSSSTGSGISYGWTGPGTITNNTSSTPSVNTPGQYLLTVTGSNGCSDDITVDVTPDANFPTADAGGSITVDCSTPFPVNLDGTSSSSGANYSYFWSTLDGGAITNNTTTSPTISNSGTYTITVIDNNNNCESTASVTVITDTISPVALTSGSETSITCLSNFVATITGASSTGSGIQFNWSTIDGTIDTQNSNTGVATVSSSGTYNLTTTSSNGCSDDIDIIVVWDTTSPLINLLNPGDLGCSITSLTIDASSTVANNPTFLWSDNSANSMLNVTSPGNYSVIVTDNNGCSSSDNVTVGTLSGPIANFSSSTNYGAVPLEVEFTDASIGLNISHDWDFGNGNTSSSTSPIETFNEVGDFTVILTVTDANGCTDTASTIVTVIDDDPIVIPNVFSPNGDGANDTFYISGGNRKEMNMVVLNRWGQTMMELDGTEAHWDGRTMAGLVASEGTYYYIITITNFADEVNEYTGHFMLVR